MAFKVIWILEGTYVVPKMLLSFIYQVTKEKSEFEWDLEQKRLWYIYKGRAIAQVAKSSPCNVVTWIILKISTMQTYAD